MEALRDYLSAINPGRVSAVKTLEKLLAQSWKKFEGCEGGMTASKLYRRMKAVEWAPPVLRFQIERHRATVRGSTLAELQEWTLDLDQRTRVMKSAGSKQVKAQQARLDVQGLVENVVRLVVEQRSDPKIKRYLDGRVQILIGQTIRDSGPKQTVEGRRRRFRKLLCDQLSSHGWSAVAGRAANTFRRIP